MTRVKTIPDPSLFTQEIRQDVNQTPRSKTQTPRPKLRNPKKPKNQDPKLKIQNPKSKLQDPNPNSKTQNPRSILQDPKTKIQIPRSKPQSLTQFPRVDASRTHPKKPLQTPGSVPKPPEKSKPRKTGTNSKNVLGNFSRLFIPQIALAIRGSYFQ